MDLFDLSAKLTLDTSEYTKGISDVESSTSGMSGNLGSALGTVGKLAGGALASTVATVSAGVGAVATASAGLAKTAVESYADYEQLTGGVETLFGNQYSSVEEYAEGIGVSLEEASATWDRYQERQQRVLDNADNAYKTAGLSANEYMETVTSFAASLNSSLGASAWQSANMADIAITDMADNANKMGTSMESIQNAYQGFAKQNFTMLDNLKLGYGGTEAEMERLLRDAEQMEGYYEGALSTDSFADVIDAIHIVQENLGITGTTAEEASTTIEGSLGSMKSAWENLVTGLADENADFGQLVDNLVNSLVGENEGEGVINQILPRVETALNGIGELIEKLVPELLNVIPPMLLDLAPSLLEAGSSLVTTLVESISTNLPQITDLIMQVVELLSTTILENLPTIIECGLQITLSLIEGISSNLSELIPTIIEVILTIVDTLTSNLDKVVEGAVALITGLSEGLISALPILIEKAPEIILNLVNALIDNLPTIVDCALQLMISLGVGLIEALPEVVAQIPQIVVGIAEAFVNEIETFVEIGKNIVSGLWEGIQESWSALVKSVKEMASDLADSFADVLGIHSPSKVFAKFGDYCVQGFDEGISDLTDGTTWNNMIGRMQSMPIPTLNVNATNMNGSDSQNVTVVLQGDADKLFRVVQSQSSRYTRLTGQPAF